MFCDFFEKFGCHFWRDKIFLKSGQLLRRGTLRVKNFVEIALSTTVFEIQGFLCFAFLKKFENSKWRPFLASDIFVETWKG